MGGTWYLMSWWLWWCHGDYDDAIGDHYCINLSLFFYLMTFDLEVLVDWFCIDPSFLLLIQKQFFNWYLSDYSTCLIFNRCKVCILMWQHWATLAYCVRHHVLSTKKGLEHFGKAIWWLLLIVSHILQSTSMLMSATRM